MPFHFLFSFSVNVSEGVPFDWTFVCMLHTLRISVVWLGLDATAGPSVTISDRWRNIAAVFFNISSHFSVKRGGIFEDNFFSPKRCRHHSKKKKKISFRKLPFISSIRDIVQSGSCVSVSHGWITGNLSRVRMESGKDETSFKSEHFSKTKQGQWCFYGP